MAINPRQRTQPGQNDKERRQWDTKPLTKLPAPALKGGMGIKGAGAALARMSQGRDGRK